MAPSQVHVPSSVVHASVFYQPPRLQLLQVRALFVDALCVLRGSRRALSLQLQLRQSLHLQPLLPQLLLQVQPMVYRKIALASLHSLFSHRLFSMYPWQLCVLCRSALALQPHVVVFHPFSFGASPSGPAPLVLPSGQIALLKCRLWLQGDELNSFHSPQIRH